MGVAGRIFEWDLAGLQEEMKELGMEWKKQHPTTARLLLSCEEAVRKLFLNKS